MRRAVVPLIAALTAVRCAAGSMSPQSQQAGPVTTTAAITEQDTRTRVRLIAHDSMQGRFTGSEGHVEVTDYLARELLRLGLEPRGDDGTFFQSVPFVRRHLTDDVISLDGRVFALGIDYVPLHPGGRMRDFDGAQVVFGGLLNDTTAEITREEARDKFVILIHRDPTQQAGNIRTARLGHRLGTAAAIATVNAERAMQGWAAGIADPQPQYVGDDDPTEPRPAALAISAATAAALLGRPVDSTVPLGAAGGTVRGHITFRPESLVVRNVIGVLRGGDPQQANEYVALGAHSDHVPPRRGPADHDSLRAFNRKAQEKLREVDRWYLTAAERAAIRVNVDSLHRIRSPRLDSIHNGADDDASGVTVLLEIAEAMAGSREPPRRSVLFVWHAAEELGLVGSRYFTDNPTVDRAAIVAQLNLDMVGRGDRDDIRGGGPRYLQVIGWRRLSSELGDIIDRVNERQAEPFVWDLQFDAPGHPEALYCRSDHYSYARYGVPVAFFSTGLHADYHQVTDEPQYIDHGKLTRVTRLVHDVTVALANLDHRPLVDGPQPEVNIGCMQ